VRKIAKSRHKQGEERTGREQTHFLPAICCLPEHHLILWVIHRFASLDRFRLCKNGRAGPEERGEGLK